MVNLDASAFYLNLLILSAVAAVLYHRSSSSDVRYAILIGLGAILTWFVGPRFLLFYCMYWLVVRLMQWLMLQTRDGRLATPAMFVAVAVLLAPMLYWKINVDGFMSTFHMKLQSLLYALSPSIAYIDAHRATLLPVGLSYATFRALDMVMQTYLGSINEIGRLRFWSYAFCPFIIPYGPIATVQEIDVTKNVTSSDVKYGLWRIGSGFFKIFILAATLQPYGNVFAATERPLYQIFIGLYIFAIFFYMNFSGYSDLAIGSARIFAIKLPENFNWPLWRRNPRLFWANWHASLSRFAQNYIFTAAGGFRPARRNFALLCTMLVIVWWHELNLSWTLFGLYHGAGLIVHNLWSEHKPTSIKPFEQTAACDVLCRVMLFSFIAFGFPIISLPTDKLIGFYSRLLGFASL